MKAQSDPWCRYSSTNQKTVNGFCHLSWLQLISLNHLQYPKKKYMSLFFWRHNFVGWILILGGLDHLNPHDCHSFYEVQGSRSVFTSNLHVRFAGPPASMCDASADPEWWQGAGTNCGWQDSVQGSPLPSQKRNGKQHKGEPFHYCNPGTQPSQQQTSLTQSMS